MYYFCEDPHKRFKAMKLSLLRARFLSIVNLVAHNHIWSFPLQCPIHSMHFHNYTGPKLYVRVASLQPVVNARLHDLRAIPCLSGSR